MADMLGVNITGMKDVVNALSQLAPRVATKVRSQAVRAGAQLITDSMKKHEHTSSRLNKSIGIKLKSYPASDISHAVVGPRRSYNEAEPVTKATGGKRGTDRFGGIANIAHLVEKGFDHYVVDHDPVRVAAQPYARPAFDETSQTAQNLIGVQLVKGTEREANLLRKK